MKEPRALRDWKKCVNMAKKHLNYPGNTYGILPGRVLELAQKGYCLMGY